MHLHKASRPAATMVEFALVGSLTFLMILGLMVGGVGIWLYTGLTSIAREAARQASVHGTQYKQTTGNSNWSQTDVYNKVIQPQANAFGFANLSYSMSPATVGSPYSTVTVTLSYPWVPPAYIGGLTMTVSSTAVVSN